MTLFALWNVVMSAWARYRQSSFNAAPNNTVPL